jgi:hypothetical protein
VRPALARAAAYLRGFVEEGTPQSSARAAALFLALNAAGVAWYGAIAQHDTSPLVLSLLGGSSASLALRKSASPPADRTP